MEKSVPKQFVFMLHDTCSKLTILTIFFSYFTFNFTFEKLAINPRFFGTKAYFKFLKFSFEREKLDKLSGFAQLAAEHFSMVNFSHSIESLE